MQTTRTDPPYVPLRRSGWPTRRAPRWAIAAGAVLLAAAIAVGLSHRPTTGQRATDFRGLLQQLNADIESCSGGVRESLFVLHRIDAGTSSDVKTAVNGGQHGVGQLLARQQRAARRSHDRPDAGVARQLPPADSGYRADRLVGSAR